MKNQANPEERFEQLQSVISWYVLKSSDFMFMGEKQTCHPEATITSFKNVCTRDYLYLITQGTNALVQIPKFPLIHFQHGDFMEDLTGTARKHHANGFIAILKPHKQESK